MSDAPQETRATPATTQTTLVSTTEEGWAVAWQHLCQAWRAAGVPLVRDIRHRMPPLPRWRLTGSHVYLLANCELYGFFAFQFLVTLLHASAFAPVRDPLLQSRAADLVWGVTALLVCVAQIAALVARSSRIWLVSAVVTASWASAFGVILLSDILAQHGTNFGALNFWTWVLTVHLILVRNRLVPISDASSLAEHQETVDDHALVTQLQSLLEHHTTENGGVTPAP